MECASFQQRADKKEGLGLTLTSVPYRGQHSSLPRVGPQNVSTFP